MKNIRIRVVYILLIIINLSFELVAQNYTVLHVGGDIRRQSTGQRIKVGEKIDKEEILSYFSPKSKAVLVSKETGRVVLSGEYAYAIEQGSDYEMEMGYSSPLKMAILPRQRSGKPLKFDIYDKVSDFKAFFGTSRFAIIGNKLEVEIDEQRFADFNSKFIYHYQIGKDSIGKEIPRSENTLIISKNDLYFNNGKILNPEDIEEASVFYQTQKDKIVSEKLVSFQPVFVDEESVYQEVKTLLEFLENPQDVEKVKTEILNFVYDVYGRVDVKSFVRWSEKKGLLPKK
ncbi:MAG: hypothetical protein OHK0038_19240 [Flammeovirgaceae bacterium]